MKHELIVNGMTCGGCVKSVQNAVARLDSQAKTNVDLQSKKVTIESNLPKEKLVQVIADAGFEPLSS